MSVPPTTSYPFSSALSDVQEPNIDLLYVNEKQNTIKIKKFKF